MIEFLQSLIQPGPFQAIGLIGTALAILMPLSVWAACCAVMFGTFDR